MVSIRLIALTAWLLMLVISPVFGVPRRSQVPDDARHAITNRLLEARDNVYHNQYLYFCVIWQHFREYFEDENLEVLDFLDDLQLTPRTDGEQVNLETIRTNVRDWIPEYRRRVAQCPDVRIPQDIQIYGSIGRLMQLNGRIRFTVLIDALKQDYVRYRAIVARQDKLQLVGRGMSGSPFTVFAQLARARFIKTVLWTFSGLFRRRRGRQGNNLVAPEQVNPVGAAPAAVGAAVPAAILQPQVPNPPPRVPSPRLVPQIVPNPPPRVPSPRLVVPQIVPNPRPPHIPSRGLDLLAEVALAQRQQIRLGQQVGDQPRRRGSPPRRGHGHQGRRDVPRED